VFPLESFTVRTCPDLPARMHTAIQSPAVLFAGKESEEELVMPASLLACWTKVMLAAWTGRIPPMKNRKRRADHVKNIRKNVQMFGREGSCMNPSSWVSDRWEQVRGHS